MAPSLEMVSDSPAGEILGETTKEYVFEACGEKLDMAQLQEIWEGKLEPVYPYRKAGPTVEKINGKLTAPAAPKIGVAKPKVIIPVFPGTNCEYDTAKAFARAGADPEILVIRNLTPADVTASCEALVKAIGESQIVMLPGGFSGGDEPDGSAKFIASFFRSPDGRVFGKMGHSERSGEYLYKNVTGDKYQPIFEGGVDYFKV